MLVIAFWLGRAILGRWDSDPQHGAGFTCVESEGFQTAAQALPVPAHTAPVQPAAATAQDVVLRVWPDGPHQTLLGLANWGWASKKASQLLLSPSGEGPPLKGSATL